MIKEKLEKIIDVLTFLSILSVIILAPYFWLRGNFFPPVIVFAIWLFIIIILKSYLNINNKQQTKEKINDKL